MSDSTRSARAVSRDTPLPSAALNRRYEADELLWARTHAAATPEVDFEALAHLSLDQWELRVGGRSRDKYEGFRIFSRRTINPNVPATTEVLAAGELQCSLAEAAALLRCTDESRFNSSMSGMYGHSFQGGSVVHTFAMKRDANPSTPLRWDPLQAHRCVKTASFARSRLAVFGHDERWCFLEEFAPAAFGPTASRNGFTMSQRSLQPDSLPQPARPPIELARRRRGSGFTRSKKRIHQLVGLSLGYSVEVISGRQPAAVSIVFYGRSSDEEGQDTSIVRRRMMLLARGVLKLPSIMRRSRMGAQVPADHWSIGIYTSSPQTPQGSPRCVNCSRALHKLLMAKKTRCYLCAHFVCSHCWIRQPLEAANGRGISVLVCPHCQRSVQNCNYAHLVTSSLSSRVSGSSVSTLSRTSMRSGCAAAEAFFRTAEVLADADDAPQPGRTVVAHFEEILGQTANVQSSDGNDGPNARVQAATDVLKQIICVLDEGVNRVLKYSQKDDMAACSNAEEDTKARSPLQTLQLQFTREVLPLEACVLSNAVTRTYAIDTSGGGRAVDVKSGPIPPNEDHRVQAITRNKLLVAKGSRELAIVCELATRELGCMASMVTIVGSAFQYVLATDYTAFQDAELPREHTLCQHLLMGDRPLLVQHPEADVRFSNLDLVVRNGIQFYCGFPIFSQDGLSVVGSLCCLDVRSRELTQSQYSTLVHLTRTASNIIDVKTHQGDMKNGSGQISYLYQQLRAKTV